MSARTLSRRLAPLVLAFLGCPTLEAQGELTPAEGSGRSIRLVDSVALSPDGKRIVFGWLGDVWSAPIYGGTARRLTFDPSRDAQPCFSPNGSSIAFLSSREANAQICIMPAEGGPARRISRHTEGFGIEEWWPDGRSLLVSAQRDHFWRHAERFFRYPIEGRDAPDLLFDGYAKDGTLSPDGRHLLFTREGTSRYRKGYHGSQASQLWLFTLESGEFRQLTRHAKGERWPLWAPDGKHYYVVSQEDGAFNLWYRSLDGKQNRQVTHFEDDGVMIPAISRDGSTITFRQLFDLYRLDTRSGGEAVRIDLFDGGAISSESLERRVLSSASAVAFTNDAREIALIAGGDVWVMDTELREPKQVTATPEEERELVFSPDGERLIFVSDRDGQPDIWQATRADAKNYWWLNEKFEHKRLTNDPEREFALRWTPDGSKLAYLKVRGDLWLMDADGSHQRRVFESWNVPDFDFSPDGKWIVYALADNDFNRDVWLLELDGKSEPFNLSRHPDNEGDPRWSPDGKKIAFTGRRWDTETDIYYVWLAKKDEEISSRDLRLKKALAKMKGRRKPAPKPAPAEPAGKKKEKPAPKVEKPGGDKPKAAASKANKEKPTKGIHIDFEGLNERLHRISIPDSVESRLIWSPDSKRLAFTASIQGRSGYYSVEIPSSSGRASSPKFFSTSVGSHPRWLKEGNQIAWLLGGKPATLSASGKSTTYSFSAKQILDLPTYHAAIFDQAWAAMRDGYYDERLGNRNWDAVRRKYRPMAAACLDMRQLSTVGNMMLGELNGSHLGFYAGMGFRMRRRGSPMESSRSSSSWREVTGHLGVRFERGYKGPGLRVRDVIEGTPAAEERSRIEPGEIIRSIDGTNVDPGMNLADVLTGDSARVITLVVRNSAGEDRKVEIRPTTCRAVRAALYEKWIKDNRKRTAALSKGRLGYMHIRGMNWSSFQRFEAELYSVGYGKDGIIIDVRENGGGSTTDHLLTVLCQPDHAITVPRGSKGSGYPHDRRVYATWDKPIVVLCNQNSFSNAEIFPHAIKTLGRGKIVGVTTAGCVISTGGASLMGGAAMVRMPFRGWFLLKTGEDMELNGCVPDVQLWPAPCEWPSGHDRQLDKACEVLLADCNAWLARPRPKLRKASER